MKSFKRVSVNKMKLKVYLNFKSIGQKNTSDGRMRLSRHTFINHRRLIFVMSILLEKAGKMQVTFADKTQQKPRLKISSKRKNILHNGKLQKSRREYSEFRVDLHEELESKGYGLEFYRGEKKHLKNQVRLAKREIAEEEFNGNVHALSLTELRQETQDMEELLQKVTSQEQVKARGKKIITLQEFGYNQAFALGLCSKKAIYQHNQKTEKFMFKHMLRCGRRSCPVCGHFSSIKEGKQIVEELHNKLASMNRDEKKNGRLYHIVLTHENVELDRVFEIFKVWRHIQKMKKKVYKKKDNPYSIWNILKWGLWRWEVTRDEETGLYHPHLHIIAYMQGWMAAELNGYWNRLVESWKDSCANVGLEANWNGQHYGIIMFFKEEKSGDPRALHYDFTREELAEIVDGAVAEMAKYAVKSTDFTKIKRTGEDESTEQIANEMAKLFSMMNGRKIKNGFGGFSLRADDEEGDVVDVEEGEEVETEGEHLSEVIYTWSNKQKRYLLQTWRRWQQERFDDYIKDMRCYKERHDLMMHYGLEREAT